MRKTLKPEIIAVTERNKLPERIHHGWICHTRQNKILYQKGDIDNKTFLRSAFKPIQALPLVETGIKLKGHELAVICGSHTGSKKHLNTLTTLMRNLKIHESEILCGKHLPIDKKERLALVKNQKSSSVLHNNCSGKHIGMIYTCKQNDLDLKTYRNIKHPLQIEIFSTLKMLSEITDIQSGIDGCGVPTYGLPIKNIGILFNNFFTHTSSKLIINAIQNHPYYLGGNHRIDSEIIKCSSNKLIAKVGAEGLIVIARGNESIVIKVADGSEEIRGFITVKTLLRLGWLTKKNIEGTMLEKINSGIIYNLHKQLVGSIYEY